MFAAPSFRSAPLRATMALALLSVTAVSHAAEGERQRVLWRGAIVEYFERDGLAIAEGDIVLGTAEEMRAAQTGMPRLESGIRSQALAATDAQLWGMGPSGVVEVPYVYEAGNRTEVELAVAMFNATFNGVIKWVPRVAQPDYVAFNMTQANLNSCNSSVGRVGGRQQIAGDPTCDANLLLHEMGHAIGLIHTQNDPAAAAFLEIRSDRISPRYRSQSMPDPLSRAFNGYDYRSIMHYARASFVMTPDVATLETKPPGIDIGIRDGYSAGDVDTIRRLYGAPPSATTVTTNPPGLHVLVDGQDVVTPAVFNWPIGSVHQLGVPAGIQALDGFRFGFGRWSHDPSAAPSASATWTVTAGKGYPGQPATAPETTVLTANFVRLVAVNPLAPSGASGSVSITPETTPWPGSANLYPIFTKFTMTAAPAPDRQNVWTWGSAYSMTGGFGASASATVRIASGLAAQNLGGAFVVAPAAVLTVAGPGVDRSVGATLARPSGASSDILLPYATGSGAPGTYKITLKPDQTRGTDVRIIVDGIDGLDDPATGTFTLPATPAFKAVTVRAHKELQSVVQRNPSCGGTLSISNAGPWHAYGTTLNLQATANAGAVFAGWSGSVSGNIGTISTVVGDAIPELVANFNTIAEPLALASVSPASLTGAGPWTLELRGGGFTPSTVVGVGGFVVQQVQYVDSHLLRATVSASYLQRGGKSEVLVYNPLFSNCYAFSQSLALDSTPATAPRDYSDMWWAGAAENGWGVSITQHGNTQFIVLYIYDAAGNPVWYVMPGGAWSVDFGTYAGSLYRPTSAPFSAYDPAQFKANAPVGNATLTYTGVNSATLAYTIDGVSGTKKISRQSFGNGEAPLQVRDLWWNPAENGWGVNIAQQGGQLFPVWYTYDAAGKDTWFVVPGGSWNGNSFTGDMYATTGSAWLGTAYNAAALAVNKVGSMKLDFLDAGHATMTYTVNGVTQAKTIGRQPF